VVRYSRSYFNQGGEVHDFYEPRRKSGFFVKVVKLFFDLFMIVITHGFWLVWVVIRELKK
jgi:hypothetical protein